MDLSSLTCHSATSSSFSRRRILSSAPSASSLVMMLLWTVTIALLPLTSAYTCIVSRPNNNGRLLCRHGTKSTSGVFDARRITILYMQTEEEASSFNMDIANSTTTTATVHHDRLPLSNKREKLRRLVQHMRGVAPKLRICLPSFMARLRSIETELNDMEGVNVDDDDGQTTMMIEVEEEQEILLLDDDRSATAASHVDLSGTWRPIVTPEFKAAYDQYLQNCSQSYLFRKVVVNGIALQKEIIFQLQDGKDLQIVASNPAGNWNRTLIASSAQEPIHVTIQDPDGDTVQVEAWWEDQGRVHKSWLRNKPRLLGGAFETSRYLSEEDPNILLCDSIFHPSPDAPASKGFKYGRVLWKFQREV